MSLTTVTTIHLSQPHIKVEQVNKVIGPCSLFLTVGKYCSRCLHSLLKSSIRTKLSCCLQGALAFTVLNHCIVEYFAFIVSAQFIDSFVMSDAELQLKLETLQRELRSQSLIMRDIHHLIMQLKHYKSLQLNVTIIRFYYALNNFKCHNTFCNPYFQQNSV